jgi:preprotein translocase subunit SecG
MQFLSAILLGLQMVSALIMIGLILVQHGKGADMGAAFGSGGSGSLFGASGSANFMSRATGVLATVFFVCTLALAYFSGVRPVGSTSVLDRPAVSAPAGAPAGAASGAAPIPTGATPAPVAVPAAPAASGAAPAATAAPAPSAAASAPAAAMPAVTGTAPIPTK